MLLLTTACTALLPLLGPTAPPCFQTPRAGHDPAAAMRAMRAARDVCDWNAIVVRARAAKAETRRGSEPWFEACAQEVTALYQLWRPEELELAAREALSVADDLRKANPDARRSGIGPLEPFAAGCVTLMRNDLARVLQSRGEHSEAIGHLRLLLDDLYAGPISEAPGHMAKAGLDVARGLAALGRFPAARESLISLRNNYSGTTEGAVASVILQSGRDNLDAYRGKYQGDAAQRRRMEEFLSALPAARRMLAERLGWSEEEISRPPIGFVDMLPDVDDLGAITTGDARRPEFSPAVVIFSETLALGLMDSHVALAHELGHVVQTKAFGPAHDLLPAWIREGISEMLANQLEDNVDRLLAARLGVNPERFVGDEYSWEKALAFEPSGCSGGGGQAPGFSFRLLQEKHGVAALRKLVAALSAGRSVDDAFQEATGLAASDYLTQAKAEVRSTLEDRRARLAAEVGAIVKARERGPSAVLAEAERTHGQTNSPIARTFARWERAKALQTLARLEEALSAFDEMFVARPVFPLYIEEALRGKAGTLIALRRSEEARAVLGKIRRDVTTKELVRWAGERLAELGAAGPR